MLQKKIKKQLEKNNFWDQICIHSGNTGVQAEHALFYGRKQINECWAIVPVAPEYNYNPNSEIKEKSAYIAMLQCKKMGQWEKTKIKYPKKNWDKEFVLLNEKHKDWEYYKTDILR